MKLSDLRNWARRYLLVKAAQLVDADVNVLLNKAKDSVTIDLALNPKSKLFTITDGTAVYSIASDIGATDYLLIRKEGIDWYDGSDWKKLDGVTREYLNRDYPNWKNEDEGSPRMYFLEGDKITFYNTPDTTAANGAELFYIGQYADMADDSHYPFYAGSDQTVGSPQFDMLDDCIFAYVEWKAEKLKSKNDTNAQAGMYQNYLNEIARASKIINKRADVYANRKARYQGTIHTR